MGGPALPQAPHLSHLPGKILPDKIVQSFRRFRTTRWQRRRRAVPVCWEDLDRPEMDSQGSNKFQTEKQMCVFQPIVTWSYSLLSPSWTQEKVTYNLCLGRQKKSDLQSVSNNLDTRKSDFLQSVSNYFQTVRVAA